MTILNIPRDDLGRQRLEEANAARGAAQPIAPVTAATPLGPRPAPGRNAASPRKLPPAERRGGDRRRAGDRRAEARPVLLDTRSPYPRRTRDRRRSDDRARAAASLDVYS